MVDANVSEDLLVVTYKTGVVKIYSLRWIIDNCTVMKASLGEFVELKRCFSADMRIRAGAMGNPGFGIPHTVVFTGRYKVKRSNFIIRPHQVNY